MGMEFEVTSLDDMCSLMCDNALPKERKSRKERTTMSKEERIENIRFQGGMNVMLNVLERLEKAEERIYDLCSEVNALSLEVSLLRRDKAIGKENPNGIQT